MVEGKTAGDWLFTAPNGGPLSEPRLEAVGWLGGGESGVILGASEPGEEPGQEDGWSDEGL